MTEPIETLSAVRMLELFRSGESSPVEVTDAVLARAERLQPSLNCFYEIDHVGARAAAAASGRRWAAHEPLGPLDGVPVTVKENVALAGFRQPSGTAAKYDAPVAAHDGPIAARLRESGAVISAITVMPDYGMLSSGVSSLHGVTRSPWNPAWTVGGSSSGAGAAAAAGIGPLHTGSDIGGSLRLPATWLGLVTLKPSFGRIPLDPPYMGRVAGPLTRTTEDAALLMSVLTGPDVRDYTALRDEVDWGSARYPRGQSVRGLQIAFHLDGGAGMPTDPEVRASVLRAVELFAAAGADVTEIAPPMTTEYLDELDLFLRVRSLADYEQLPPDRQELVLDFIREWVLAASGISGTRVLRAYQSVQDLRRSTVLGTASFDLVLSPVAPVAAFPAEWPMPSDDPADSLAHIAYTAPYNFSEQPASSVNCGVTRDGRPIGLQIAGRRFDDLGVLRATAWWEENRPVDAVPDWPF